jgi:hypothetical protein
MDFIKAMCHLGKYVTTAMNTEDEQADIQVLKHDLDLALLHINISSHARFYLTFPTSNRLAIVEIIEHS